jgi:toxin co-regulated pilus biosynthesis protein E
MKSAIDALSQQGVAVSVLIGKMSYPITVILMACAIIIYLEGSVFEQFKLIKPVEEWPEAGQFLLTLASVIKYWWWIFILAVVGLVLLMRKIFSSFVGDQRALVDNYFPFNIYRKLVAARLLETLGLLVANGVVFKSALKVMQYQANPYMAWHLRHMENLLSTGKTNIAEVLDTGLIENQNLMRLRIMAEVKGFEHGLIRMGSTGTKETTETLKKIASIIGGLLLIVGVFLIISVVRGIFMTGMAMGS